MDANQGLAGPPVASGGWTSAPGDFRGRASVSPEPRGLTPRCNSARRGRTMDGIPTPGHWSRLPYHWGSGSHFPQRPGIVMRMQCPNRAS